MTGSATSRQVRVEDEGRVVAEAELQQCDPPGTVQASVHVESGHLPVGARAQLVADVFDSAEVKGAERFKGVVPRGDSELLGSMRDRLQDSVTRSAGASVIVEADTPHA
jgi:hypothetical protein